MGMTDLTKPPTTTVLPEDAPLVAAIVAEIKREDDVVASEDAPMVFTDTVGLFFNVYVVWDRFKELRYGVRWRVIKTAVREAYGMSVALRYASHIGLTVAEALDSAIHPRIIEEIIKRGK